MQDPQDSTSWNRAILLRSFARRTVWYLSGWSTWHKPSSSPERGLGSREAAHRTPMTVPCSGSLCIPETLHNKLSTVDRTTNKVSQRTQECGEDQSWQAQTCIHRAKQVAQYGSSAPVECTWIVSHLTRVLSDSRRKKERQTRLDSETQHGCCAECVDSRWPTLNQTRGNSIRHPVAITGGASCRHLAQRHRLPCSLCAI